MKNILDRFWLLFPEWLGATVGLLCLVILILILIWPRFRFFIATRLPVVLELTFKQVCSKLKFLNGASNPKKIAQVAIPPHLEFLNELNKPSDHSVPSVYKTISKFREQYPKSTITGIAVAPTDNNPIEKEKYALILEAKIFTVSFTYYKLIGGDWIVTSKK